jgi:type II secretory pathway pseudopilin PulG
MQYEIRAIKGTEGIVRLALGMVAGLLPPELRDAIDTRYSDTDRYPDTLEALVAKKTIRSLPVDPVTESAATRIAVRPAEGTKGAVYDVRSGAPGKAASGGAFADLQMSTQRGFTYVGLLLAIALAGVALAAAGTLWSTAAKRDKEAELLFVGDQFRRAIDAYYEGTPGAKRFPQRLEELVEDKRLPVTRRHLRRIYVDPMTGKPDWDLVRLPDGAIVGVRSRSEARPLKTANFAPHDASFANAATYRDWVFSPAPLRGVVKPVAPAPGDPVSTAQPIAGSAAPEAPPPR